MRRHHEEIVAAPAIVPALSLLIPFVAALWERIRTTSQTRRPHLPERPEVSREPFIEMDR
jgi:hypothetical protein